LKGKTCETTRPPARPVVTENFHRVLAVYSDSDHGVSAFLCARGRLFGNAYRMLKSAAEAEDTMQEVWILSNRRPPPTNLQLIARHPQCLSVLTVLLFNGAL
jgi:hypothetical protein